MDTSTKLLIGSIVLSITVYLVYNISKRSTKLENPSEWIEERVHLRDEVAITVISGKLIDYNDENTTLPNMEVKTK